MNVSIVLLKIRRISLSIVICYDCYHTYCKGNNVGVFYGVKTEWKKSLTCVRSYKANHDRLL